MLRPPLLPAACLDRAADTLARLVSIVLVGAVALTLFEDLNLLRTLSLV